MAEQRHRCNRCDAEKLESEFRHRTINGEPYRLKACIECERAESRRRWREKRPERLEYQRNYRKRNKGNPEFRAADNAAKRDRYANDPTYRARRKQIARERYAKIKTGEHVPVPATNGRNPEPVEPKVSEADRVWGVNLPVAVVAPVLEVVKRTYAGGVEGMAEIIGVSDTTLSKILKPNGKKTEVSIDIADRIVLHSDFNLEDLYDRAAEWAHLTGDPWPKGYNRTRL